MHFATLSKILFFFFLIITCVHDILEICLQNINVYLDSVIM